MNKDISDLRKQVGDGTSIARLIKGQLRRHQTPDMSPSGASLLTRLLKSQSEVLKRKKQKITFSRPLISWPDETPLLFPNTINIIQGKAGTHKSRLAAILAAICLRTNERETDILGLVRHNDSLQHLSICYIDTERNKKDQLPYAVQSIQELAGVPIKEDLDNLLVTSLLDVPRPKRVEAVKTFLAHAQEQSKGHLVVFLDVITDCVADFNNVGESMALIDIMNQMINSFDVTFVGVIHENPGNGYKARGHLGTELMNKATTVFQVSLEENPTPDGTDGILIKVLKNRNAKRPGPMMTRYCEQSKTLVLMDAKQVAQFDQGKPVKAPLQQVRIALYDLLVKGAMSKAELIKALGKKLDASTRTLETRLKTILEEQQAIFDGKDDQFVLQTEKQGRQQLYSIIPIEKASN